MPLLHGAMVHFTLASSKSQNVSQNLQLGRRCDDTKTATKHTYNVWLTMAMLHALLSLILLYLMVHKRQVCLLSMIIQIQL